MMLTDALLFVRRHRVAVAAAVVVCTAAAVAACRCLPSSAADMRRSAAVVETRTWYELRADGRAALFFCGVGADTLLSGLAADTAGAAAVRLSAACWVNRWPVVPSCRGRLVTALPPAAPPVAASPQRLLDRARRQLADSVGRGSHDVDELGYYLRVHGVQDEGYQEIAALATARRRRLAAMRRALDAADSLAASGARLTVARVTAHSVCMRRADGSAADTVGCRVVAADVKRHIMLLQTGGGVTPGGARPQYLLPWNTANHTLLAVGLGGLGVPHTATAGARPTVVECRRKGRSLMLPRVLTPPGTPLFTPRGLFAGVSTGDGMARRTDIAHLLMKGGWR